MYYRIKQLSKHWSNLLFITILHNHQADTQSVAAAHVIRCLTIFKIVAFNYRNRRKQFALRLNQIAAFTNLNLCKWFNKQFQSVFIPNGLIIRNGKNYFFNWCIF